LIDQGRKEPEYPNGRLVPIWVYFPKQEGPQVPCSKFLEERAQDIFDSLTTWKNLNEEVFGKKENDL